VTEAEWLTATEPGPILSYLSHCGLIREERHWLRRLRPGQPIDWIGPAAADRKLWLFALACCGRVETLLARARVHRARSEAEKADPRESLSLAERLLEGDSPAGPWPLNRRFHVPRVVSPAEHALAAACYAAVDFFNEDRRGAVAIFARQPSAGYPRGVVESPRVPHSTIAGVLTSYETRLAVARAAAGPPPPNDSLGWHADWNKAERAESAAHACMLRCLFGNPFARPPSVEPGWLAGYGSIVPKLATAIYTGRTFNQLPVLADALEDAGCTDPDLLGHLRGPGPHVRGCWAVDLVLGKE
jgi:hypothetical protein